MFVVFFFKQKTAYGLRISDWSSDGCSSDLSLSGCGINSVPAAQETVKAKWADVQNQYQRRADLVPNLVAVVKGYARQEQDTLTQVTEARAKATSVQVSADDLQNPEKMAAFQAAQKDRKSTRMNSSHQ